MFAGRFDFDADLGTSQFSLSARFGAGELDSHAHEAGIWTQRLRRECTLYLDQG